MIYDFGADVAPGGGLFAEPPAEEQAPNAVIGGVILGVFALLAGVVWLSADAR